MISPDASLATLVVVFIDRPLVIQWISRSGEIQQTQHLRFEDIAAAQQHAEALRDVINRLASDDDVEDTLAVADWLDPKEEA